VARNIVHDYGWTKTEGPESCGYIAPRILDLLAGLQAKRVLDIGSGNGSLCKSLQDAGLEPVGMEFDKGGIEISRRLYPEIRFYNYGVEDDPGELRRFEAEFDAVVSTEVIEHLFSPHLLPRFAARCLRRGGHLVLSTPYHGYAKNLALSVFDKWDAHHTPLWHGGHIKFWSRRTLSALLAENGYEVVDFGGVGRVPYLWKSMIIVARPA